MTKQQQIDFVEKNIDWYNRMTKGLGHSSWWYTNRSTDDCINVKIYAWADIDDIKGGLTEKEKEEVEVLGIDVDGLVEDIIWGDYGIVDEARMSLKNELIAKHKVQDVEYGGRSGGWLAVVFDWEAIDEDEEYTKDAVDKIKEAQKENEEVIALVEKRKKELEATIKNNLAFIDKIKEIIADIKQTEQNKAKRILDL